MFKRFTLLLPAAAPGWEVWSCPSAAACIRQSREAAGAELPDKIPGRLVVGLPSRFCRTFSLHIPSRDPKTARQLALVQLEKRGLAVAPPDQTAFECHLVPVPGEGALLSVDVAAPEAASAFAALNPAGFVAAAKCYDLPDGSLILTREQDRLVLWATNYGTVLHSHIVSAAQDQWDQVAAEIRITSLTLQQMDLLPEITGLDILGDFNGAETAALGAALALPVRLHPRSSPDPVRAVKFCSPRLLSATGRASQRGRRLHSVKWLSAAAAASLVLLWGAIQYRELADLERRAAALEESVNASAGTGQQEKMLRENVRATQERWHDLRMALEPRRYPMIHLNSITRCLGGDGVVLSRFESKGPDLAVSGTAQSAREAYSYYTAVSSDPELRIYSWSMVQPVLADNGTASFQIKGKMR